MNRLLTPARIAFGLATAYFGAQYLLHGRFLAGLPPVPPWIPGAPALAYLVGLVLLASGVLIAIGFRAPTAALVVATLSLVAALLYAFHLRDILQNGSVRTSAFEALAISGAAFVLVARLLPGSSTLSSGSSAAVSSDLLGRLLFAVSMLVFGEQHFQYVAFVAPLIPSWIPAHVSFVYFTGICFVAAGLAIGFDRVRSLAATLLGLMFLSWVLIVHLPRMLPQPHNTDELVSGFVAFILAAGSFAIAATLDRSHASV